MALQQLVMAHDNNPIYNEASVSFIELPDILQLSLKKDFEPFGSNCKFSFNDKKAVDEIAGVLLQHFQDDENAFTKQYFIELIECFKQY